MSRRINSNAKLYDVNSLIEMGINPKTGLPMKLDSKIPALLKENIKTQLRIIDEQDHVNLGVWYNIPCDIKSQDLNRMLYYKYQVCLFYSKDFEQFFILPFTLATNDRSSLDAYGRYKYIKPLCYYSSTEAKEGEKEEKKTPLEVYFSQLKLKVIYEPIPEENLTEEDLYNSAVILQDYTPQFNNKNGLPRCTIQDSLLDVMADCIPLLRTSLLLESGVTGVRVADGDQANEVIDAAASMYNNAMAGVPWIAMVGGLEFQQLTESVSGRAQEFLLAMQGLDNFRLSTYGIDNGGLFEKKAHTLQSEADMNGGPVGLVVQDKTTINQEFCNIVNSIWQIGMWYEPSETITKTDTNGDGVMYDRNDDGSQGGIETGGANDEPSE